MKNKKSSEKVKKCQDKQPPIQNVSIPSIDCVNQLGEIRARNNKEMNALKKLIKEANILLEKLSILEDKQDIQDEESAHIYKYSFIKNKNSSVWDGLLSIHGKITKQICKQAICYMSHFPLFRVKDIICNMHQKNPNVKKIDSIVSTLIQKLYDSGTLGYIQGGDSDDYRTRYYCFTQSALQTIDKAACWAGQDSDFAQPMNTQTITKKCKLNIGVAYISRILEKNTLPSDTLLEKIIRVYESLLMVLISYADSISTLKDKIAWTKDSCCVKLSVSGFPLRWYQLVPLVEFEQFYELIENHPLKQLPILLVENDFSKIDVYEFKDYISDFIFNEYGLDGKVFFLDGFQVVPWDEIDWCEYIDEFDEGEDN